MMSAREKYFSDSPPKNQMATSAAKVVAVVFRLLTNVCFTLKCTSAENRSVLPRSKFSRTHRARVERSDAVDSFEGTVGTSGQDINFNSVAFVTGDTVDITDLPVTMPAS